MSLILASTGEDGQFVSANAGNLSGKIELETTIVLTADVPSFIAGVVLIVDSERMTISTDNGAGSLLVARGAESTTAIAHATSSNVRMKDGTTVLTHTFTGSQTISGVRVNSPERDAIFGIEIDGTVKYLEAVGPYEGLSKFFPFRPQTPASGTILKVLAWTFADQNVFAEIQS